MSVQPLLWILAASLRSYCVFLLLELSIGNKVTSFAFAALFDFPFFGQTGLSPVGRYGHKKWLFIYFFLLENPCCKRSKLTDILRCLMNPEYRCSHIFFCSSVVFPSISVQKIAAGISSWTPHQQTEASDINHIIKRIKNYLHIQKNCYWLYWTWKVLAGAVRLMFETTRNRLLRFSLLLADSVTYWTLWDGTRSTYISFATMLNFVLWGNVLKG